MNDAQPGKPEAPYIPKPGERVRILSIHRMDKGDPFYERLVGMVALVKHVHEPEHEIAPCLTLECDGESLSVFARVLPLPSSPLDVECPWCSAKAGSQCVKRGLGLAYAVGKEHAQRIHLFLDLTGQKDSVPVAPVSPMDGGAAGIANVGSERGDSGTGRAAGSERSASAGHASSGAWFGPVSQPAASSGFKAPKDVWDVPCEACRAPPRAPGVIFDCFDGDGEPMDPPHALRVAAFEARRERPEAPKRALERCRECDQEIRSYSDEATERQVAIGECVDCMISEWRPPLATVLRAELDRPLPRKVVEAERTWPPHFSGPGWEE